MKIFNNLNRSKILIETSILNVWWGSESASGSICFCFLELIGCIFCSYFIDLINVVVITSSLHKNLRIRSYSSPYFPEFGLNTERYSVSLRIQSECGKMWTRITLATFYAVVVFIWSWYVNFSCCILALKFWPRR